MRRWAVHGLVVIGISGLLGMAISVDAAEHGGQEHGGQEHGGTTTAPAAAKEHGGLPAPPAGGAQAGTAQDHGGQAMKAEPSAAQIRQAIESYVKGIEAKDGAFAIHDELRSEERRVGEEGRSRG